MAPTVVSTHHLLPSSTVFSTPPGLSDEIPVAPADAGEIDEAEQFRRSLCHRKLPTNFDHSKLSRLQVSLLSCIEGLYRDRLKPVVGEIQRRLRSSGWTFLEIQSVLPLCARNPEFTIVFPDGNETLQVLLRLEPSWFQGWINEEEFTAQVPKFWETFENVLKDDSLNLKGGINNSALSIWQRVSSELTLGEVRHVVELAMGRQSLLSYNPFNGSRLCVQSGTKGQEVLSAVVVTLGNNGSRNSRAAPTGSEDFVQRKAKVVVSHLPSKPASPDTNPPRCDELRATVPASRPMDSTSTAHVLALELRARPLPESLAGNKKALTGCQQSLRKCIESLYRDRLRPTLAEVQRRLTERSWGAEDLQAVLPLSAREPDTYEIVAPVDGKPLCIFLQKPPSWFEGWVDADRNETNYSSDVWKSLEDFLREGKPVLEGGVNGAALALRQRALPHLQHLSLGEIRDLVKRAVAERGLLTYAGGSLRPQLSTSPTAIGSCKLGGMPVSGKDCQFSGRRGPRKANGTATRDHTRGMITSTEHLAQVLRRVLETRAAGCIPLDELVQLLQDNCGLMLSTKRLGCECLVDVFHLPYLHRVFELEQSPKSGLSYVKLRRSKDDHIVQPFKAGRATDGSNRIYSVI